jgi:hypothetical protein
VSQRAASEQVVLQALRAAGSIIADRPAEDYAAAQDETVKKLIEALKLQDPGARLRDLQYSGTKINDEKKRAHCY